MGAKINLPGMGMRTIKTSAAVMICLALGQVIGAPQPVFACIAAILTVRDTVDSSIQYGISRILATLFGGAVGFLVLGANVAALGPWPQIPFIGLAVILTICVTVMLKRPDTTALSVIILLVIVLDHAEDKYVYALRRVIETIIGILAAVGCNRFLNFPPAKEDGPHT